MSQVKVLFASKAQTKSFLIYHVIVRKDNTNFVKGIKRHAMKVTCVIFARSLTN